LGGSLVPGNWRRGGTAEEIFKSIKIGYPEAGMPGFGALLPDAEVRELVAYLQEASRRPGSETARKTAGAPARDLSAAGETFVLEDVATGLETPWGIAWLPDGRMLVTERPGRLRILGTDGRMSAPVAGTPAVFAKGQGGLMDVAVHPRYAQNGWIYLSYSQPRPGGGGEAGFTAIARGKIVDGRWVEQQMIFETRRFELLHHPEQHSCNQYADHEAAKHIRPHSTGVTGLIVNDCPWLALILCSRFFVLGHILHQ
jgi:hypothetical protein